jgi:hypothetical protein
LKAVSPAVPLPSPTTGSHLSSDPLACLFPNVWGEPVFSVMAAGWFCEKFGSIGKVEDVKLVLLRKTGFQPATILRSRVFTWMNCEIDGFHLV